jgi:hypothetical protein
MSPKRPATSRPSPPPDEWKITDEWGIYDPEKAGIPALFKRLGRPVLRAAGSSARKERRRAHRPERSTEGVALVLNEVRARAGLLPQDEHPLAGGNPARAMRLALKAQAAVNAATPAPAPFVPPPAPPELPPADLRDAKPAPAAAGAVEPASPPRKRMTRRAAAAAPIEVAPPAPAAPPPQARRMRPAHEAEPGARARTRRAAKTKARGAETAPAPAPAQDQRHDHAPRQAAPAHDTAPRHAAHTAHAPAVHPAPVKAGPPAPSPRRPRGPVPLAAWARAVADSPSPAADPRRADKRGFWRGIFRMPAEVALVEYARGCRIHRLLVEAGDDHLPDFI